MSPLAVESIIRRNEPDPWASPCGMPHEETHHNQPHTVYLSATSGIKWG